MADDANTLPRPPPPPPLPPNYVSFVDLRSRWMKLHPQEDDAVPVEPEEAQGEGFGKQIQPNIEVQDDAERVEEAHVDDEKSGLHSNPNPSYGARSRPFRGRRNLHRWVQVTPPVVQLDPKPLIVPTEIHASDSKVKKENVRKNKNKKKRNQKKEEVLAPNDDHVEEKVEVDPSGAVNDRNLVVEETKMAKQKKKNKKQQPKEDVVEEKEDGLGAEIEGGIAGISFSGAPEESSSRRSVASRNPRGWRKDGGYGRFEQRVLLKKERAKRDGGLVWVKKGESTDIVAVPVENEGDVRV